MIRRRVLLLTLGVVASMAVSAVSMSNYLRPLGIALNFNRLPLGSGGPFILTPLVVFAGLAYWDKPLVLRWLGVALCLFAVAQFSAYVKWRGHVGVHTTYWMGGWILVDCCFALVFFGESWLRPASVDDDTVDDAVDS